MSTLRTYSIYVGHIRDAIERAMRFTAGVTYDQFIANDMRCDATVRTLEIVGEATKRLPAEVRALDEIIPWHDMARMRDKVIHQYDRVDLSIVWHVVHEELPSLLPRLERLRAELERREDEEWEREEVQRDPSTDSKGATDG